MKAKRSFVTNSSSTSFITVGKAAGKFPGHINDLKNTVRNWFPKIYPVGILYIDRNYVCIGGEPPDENHLNEDGDRIIEFHLIHQFSDDQEKDECPKPITYMDIKVNSPRIVESNLTLVFDDVIEVLNKVADKMLQNGEAAEFVYIQYPESLTGDGWNGGDPMGSYTYKGECYEGETKKGYISLSKNNGKTSTEFNLTRR